MISELLLRVRRSASHNNGIALVAFTTSPAICAHLVVGQLQVTEFHRMINEVAWVRVPPSAKALVAQLVEHLKLLGRMISAFFECGGCSETTFIG